MLRDKVKAYEQVVVANMAKYFTVTDGGAMVLNQKGLRSEKVCDSFEVLPLGGSEYVSVSMVSLQYMKQSNKIDRVIEYFSGFSSLRVLVLSNMELSALPLGINRMKLSSLDISNNQISEMNGLKLDTLEELDISNNNISSLDINCSGLKKLMASGNIIESVPVGMKSIVYMDISNNRISSISDKIVNLGEIEYLDLSHNDLNIFDRNITRLKSLKVLKLVNNSIRCVPYDIGLLMKLEYLDLNYNCLFSVSSGIGSLVNLVVLNLGHNCLSYIPSLKLCHKLETLYLDHNQLVEFPDSLLGLCGLKKVIIDGNKIDYIPSEACKKFGEMNTSLDRHTYIGIIISTIWGNFKEYANVLWQ